ncbi:MAG: hypothetical protein IJE74_10700 [Clostridia bacterium]|nr:hypothetical protein [Clostridia bacterium]
MKYVWKDYNPFEMMVVEEWLDAEAVKKTGLDDGWRDLYEYWLNEANTVIGENYWRKVVFENEMPFAVVALGVNEEIYNVMELVVNPKEHGKGKVASLIKELIDDSIEITGKEIISAEAVIYPSNPASKRAFEKAGFKLNRAHEDGDTLYYEYTRAKHTAEL